MCFATCNEPPNPVTNAWCTNQNADTIKVNWSDPGDPDGSVVDYGVIATNDLLEGNTEEGKSRLYYSTPTLPLLAVLGMKEDFKELYME